MKLHNILLSFLLVFQIVYANDENKNIFEYNYHCVKDNNNLCSKLQEKVTEATDSLSRVLGKKIIHLIIYIFFFFKY